MKKKKVISWLLMIILTINLLPIHLIGEEVYHPIQISNADVWNVPNPNGEGIAPRIQLTWEPNRYNTYGDGYTFSHYLVGLSEMSNGKPIGKVLYSNRIEKDKTTVELSTLGFGHQLSGTDIVNENRIENGKIYQLQVIPVFEKSPDLNRPEYREYQTPDVTTNKVYVATDFNTQIEVTEEGVIVDWEYIPGATYAVTYAVGNYNTVEEVNGSAFKDTLIINDPGKADAQGRISKVIKTDHIQGETYSAYVKIDSYKIPGGAELKINKRINAEGPKVVRTTAGIMINYSEWGKDYIKLIWGELPKSLKDKLLEIEIWIANPDEPHKKIISIPVKDKENIGTYTLVERPSRDTTYVVKFKCKNNETEVSLPVQVILEENKITPLSPKVPKPYSSGDTQHIDHLVTGDETRLESKDLNVFKEGTFHSQVKENKSIQVVWDIPNKQEENVKEKDFLLTYDIWITDQEGKFSSAPQYSEIFSSQNTDNIIYSYDIGDPVGFKLKLEKYYKTLDGNDREVPGIIPNNTYYIKMIAKRQYGVDAKDNPIYKESLPTIVGITIDKDGEIATPPVLGKPPLQLDKEKTKDTSLTIKWRTIWEEIRVEHLKWYTEQVGPSIEEDEKVLASLGSSKVFVKDKAETPGPNIRFKGQEGYSKKILYPDNTQAAEQITTATDIKEKVNELNQDANYYDTHYYDRQVSLGEDVLYEVKYEKYSEVEKQIKESGGIESWVMKEGKVDVGSGKWKTITPIDQNDSWLEYTVGGLEPNAQYIILIRAYRKVDGENKMQSLPSYVLGTTLPKEETVIPDPKVPQLNLVKGSEQDTSFKVWFEYDKNFTYEIVYSRLDDPNQGTVVSFNISNDPTSPDFLGDGGKKEVTITGLFPETEYNAWIRIKEDKDKRWSSPVNTKTTAIQSPKVPSGLGPAAYQSIVEIGQDFKPVTKDYITVEWTKDRNDNGIETSGSMERRYEYILEFADNVEFLDAIEVTVSDKKDGEIVPKDVEILAKNLIKFNNLESNRPYYVRVKTRVILTDIETKREISKESNFCDSVRILTKKSDDEYDGGENDNIVIYPDAIEESYDNGVWTWEIVDTQNIISEIITKKDYFLTVDLTLYRDRYDASVRKLRIPKAVWDALVGQRMELKVETSYGVYQIPASSLAYATEKTKAKEIIELEWRKVYTYDIEAIVKPYPYVLQKGERLSVTVEGHTSPIKKLDGMMRTELKLDYADEYLHKNMQGYTYDSSNGNWIKEQFSVQTRTDGTYLGFSTPRIGIYGLYYVSDYTLPSQMTSSMTTLNKRYEVEGLGTKFKKNDKVESDQYILLMLGISQNKSKIDLTAPVPIDMRDRAKASKLYISNNKGQITQEQAVHGVVRLYELTTGYKVKPSSRKVQGVSGIYEESIRKAYALGLIDSINASRPITYGELCDLIVQVLP